MGLIMKNEVPYGGAGNVTSAAQVSYSTSTSGLSGTSVQTAMDEIAVCSLELQSSTEPNNQRIGDVWVQPYV